MGTTGTLWCICIPVRLHMVRWVFKLGAIFAGLIYVCTVHISNNLAIVPGHSEARGFISNNSLNLVLDLARVVIAADEPASTLLNLVRS
jgi:hypothetical protein